MSVAKLQPYIYFLQPLKSVKHVACLSQRWETHHACTAFPLDRSIIPPPLQSPSTLQPVFPCKLRKYSNFRLVAGQVGKLSGVRARAPPLHCARPKLHHVLRLGTTTRRKEAPTAKPEPGCDGGLRISSLRGNCAGDACQTLPNDARKTRTVGRLLGS